MNRPRPPAPLLGLLAVASLLLGCAGGHREPPRRAILILLDAARADRFSCHGYGRETTPNLDRLAAGGVNFRRHYANGVATRNSIPTLMYSRTFAKPIFPVHLSVPFYKPADLFRALDEEAISLPAALAAGGLHTVGISAHQWFHQGSEFAREFQEFHDLPREIGYDPDRATPRAKEVIDYTIAWLDGVDEDEEFFLYLHLMDTHFPHFLDEDAAEYFGADEYEATRFNDAGYPRDLTRPLTGRDRDYLDALYDGDLRYLDRHLGRLFDHLRAKGQLASTLVMVTADHGEELLHQARRFAHGTWSEPVARIPLILSFPDRVPPATVDALTQGIDLHPTICALLGVPLPPGKAVDGLHLLEGHDDGRRDAVYAWCGLRTDRYKLITDMRKLLADPTSIGAVLYDEREDPEEREDVLARNPELFASLLREAETVLRPRFERFRSVDLDRTPTWTFAIEPRFLKVSGAEVVQIPRLAAWRDALDGPGWGRHDRRLASFLLAAPSAEPVEVHVWIPSGDYELALALAGAGRVELARDEGWIAVRAAELTPAVRPDAFEKVVVGPVRVADRDFRMRIAPLGEDGPLVIGAIEFRPAGVATEDEDAERRGDALRKLGY